jgi:hypothetical protein
MAGEALSLYLLLICGLKGCVGWFVLVGYVYGNGEWLSAGLKKPPPGWRFYKRDCDPGTPWAEKSRCLVKNAPFCFAPAMAPLSNCRPQRALQDDAGFAAVMGRLAAQRDALRPTITSSIM